jgi:hypothetical protein
MDTQEAVREIYRIGDPDFALEWVQELAATLNDRVYAPEIRLFGRMLARWAPQIAAWHRSRASNATAPWRHQRPRPRENSLVLRLLRKSRASLAVASLDRQRPILACSTSSK